MYLRYLTKESEALECFVWDDLLNDEPIFFESFVKVKNLLKPNRKEEIKVQKDEYGCYFVYNKEHIYFKNFVHLEYEELCDLLLKDSNLIQTKDILACFLKYPDKIIFSYALTVINPDPINLIMNRTGKALFPCKPIIDKKYPINNWNNKVEITPINDKIKNICSNDYCYFSNLVHLLDRKEIILFKTKEECISYVKEKNTNK